MDKLRQYVPTSGDAHMEEVLGSSPADLTEAAPKDKDSESVTKRIKVKLSDIDMSGINTDIKDWSLATTDDLKDLQSKFSETTSNVDSLEKDFMEFKKSSQEFQEATQEKLNDLDKRIESLENK